MGDGSDTSRDGAEREGVGAEEAPGGGGPAGGGVALSPQERAVLVALEDRGDAGPDELLDATDLDERVEVMNGAAWLESKKLVRIEKQLTRLLGLNDEGRRYAGQGTPERRAIEAMAEAGKAAFTLDDLRGLVDEGVLDADEVNIAVAWLNKRGWVEATKEDGARVFALTDAGRAALEARAPDEQALSQLAESGMVPESAVDDEALAALISSRKKVLETSEEVAYRIVLTDAGRRVLAQGIADAAGEGGAEVGQITPDLLQSGRWRDVTLRPYDVTAYAPRARGGKLHPLRHLIEEVRRVFLAMGFSEVERDVVQSCFWNMDALFIPQDHPAREMQDTFYLAEPADRADDLPDDAVVDAVRAVHEDGGGTESTGWGYEWSRDEAERALLRTHTTVNTIRHLAETPDEPCKVFSVGRVFRREALDATHLPEFHQIEGIVMEPGANLRQLIGLLREFYGRMGFDDVRIRPAYFPYTEPSAEVEVFYNDTWMELGGSGIFRPEVTEPFGVEWPVLAWGLGLERLAMMVYGLDDIRQLYFSDIEWLRETPVR